MIRALSDLGEAIRGDDKELAERQARELRAPAKPPLGRSPVRTA